MMASNGENTPPHGVSGATDLVSPRTRWSTFLNEIDMAHKQLLTNGELLARERSRVTVQLLQRLGGGDGGRITYASLSPRGDFEHRIDRIY